MLNKKFLLPGQFIRWACRIAIAAVGLLSVSPVCGQVGTVEDVPSEPEVVTTPDVNEEGAWDYSWLNELKYYEESVEPRKVDETSWKKTIEGLDYGKQIQPKKEAKKNANPDLTPDRPDRDFSFGSGSFFQWVFRALLLISAVAVIVLVVRNMILLKPAPKNATFQGQSVEHIDLQHIEENLNEADLDPLLQRAVAQEKYALAVRLYYLAILKKMSEQQLVRWKKDKTNRDYLRELKTTALHQPFREATRAFEWVWYGDMAIGKQDFERLQGQFQAILSLIQQNKKP